jgi:enoyl-CoA hydratase
MKYLKIMKLDGRVDVYLNRPKKFNALNRGLIKEISLILSQLENDINCRLIVLRSTSEKAFCSGVDLDDLQSFKSIEEARNFALLLDEMFIKLLKFPKPVIAVINGFAYGGGFALTSAADVRIMDYKAEIAFPAGRLGAILPPALTYMLNALVGIGTSRELLMTGRTIKSEEALHLRMVNRLITSEEIEKAIEHETKDILKSTALSLMMTRRIINQQLIVEIEKYNLSGGENFAFLASTSEWQQRIKNFLKK